MSDIKKIDYKLNETVLDKSVEQNIDLEMNLPDYCGDIGSVLQCFAFPNITESKMSTERIHIEGNTLLRVLYLSEGEIFSYEQSVPFSRDIEHDLNSSDGVLSLKTFVQYVNCRAASSRKFDIHGAFVIALKVNVCAPKSVIETISGDDIQVQKELMSACSAGGNGCARIRLNQVIDIGAGKPEMKSLIRNSAIPVLRETKQVSGKVLVKGELKIKTLYKAEDNSTQRIKNTLPISQILDIEGMQEDSTTEIKLNLSALEITVKPSAMGSMSLLDISAVIDVCACAYECIDFPVIKDCYSTRFESECSFKKVRVDKILKQISKEYMHEFHANGLPELKCVNDVWCDDIRCSAQSKGDRMQFNGTLEAYILYENEAGVLNLMHKQSDFRFEEMIESEGEAYSVPTATIVGTDYLLEEDAINIRVKIAIEGVIFDVVSEFVVDELSLGEVPVEQNRGLYVYYPKNDESLWDIARRYHTTVADILSANGLEEPLAAGYAPLLIWS